MYVHIFLLLILGMGHQNSHPELEDLTIHAIIPSVVTKWYDLGLQLFESKHKHELDTIKSTENDANDTLCCKKMLEAWLSTNEVDSNTWNKLTEALRNVGLNKLAKKLSGEWFTITVCLQLS